MLPTRAAAGAAGRQRKDTLSLSGVRVPAAIVLALIVFVIYDMRHAAQAFLGIRPLKPAIELEIRPSPAALTSIRLLRF